jgi:hypothetical protein
LQNISSRTAGSRSARIEHSIDASLELPGDLPMTAHRAIAVTALLFLSLAPRMAHAEPAKAGAGLERVSRPAASAVAEQLACASPIARRYFASTLKAIGDRNWGFVRERLEGEAEGLVVDAVYKASRGDGSVEALEAFVGRPSATCQPRELAVARTALRTAPTTSYSTDVDACAAGGIGSLRSDPACALALAAKAAFDGVPQVTARSIADLLLATSFERLHGGTKALSPAELDDLFENSVIALRDAAAVRDQERTIADEIASAFNGVNLLAIRDDQCQDGELVDMLTSGTLSSQELFCAATRADLETEKVPVYVTTPSGVRVTTTLGRVVEDAEGLEHALRVGSNLEPRKEPRDELVAEAALCAVPLPAADQVYFDCSGERLAVKRSGAFQLTLGTLTWSITLAARAPSLSVSLPRGKSLAALSATTAEVEYVRTGLEAFFEERLLGTRVRPESLRELAVYSVRLARLADVVDDVRGKERASFLSTVQSLPELVDRVAGPPPAGTPSGCVAPTTSAQRFACKARPGGSLEPVLEALDRGQARALTIRVASLLAPPPASTAGCTPGRYSQVLRAFAAFVADDERGNEKNVDPFAEAQLRTAVQEVDECSPGDSTSSGRATIELLPSLGARASWNSAYINAWGSDGFRVLPTLDTLGVRVPLAPRSWSTQVALRASLIDLLAPFTEMAMRRADVTYEAKSAGLLEFLKPRFDVLLVSPSLAPHLFVSGGVSLRTVAPFLGSDDASAVRPANRARYIPVWSGRTEASAGMGRFLEANLAAGYAF